MPNSPADRCSKLKVGQRILAINGICLTGIGHMELVQLIRQSHENLTLTVQKSSLNQSSGTILFIYIF